jgi:hypothetical protein
MPRGWLTSISLLTFACASPGSDELGSATDTSESDTSESDTSESGEPPIEVHCEVERSFPYPSPMSYVGVHAGPGNDDRVACSLPGTWMTGWTALAGRGIAQPNTFSPDGRTTYVTTSEPQPGDCSIWALDTVSGETRWCLSVPGTLFATIEVDLDGNLYTSADAAVLSWDAEGNERWATTIPGDDPERNATGVHFDPSGRVVTVTDAGVLLLLERETGSLLAQLDLPASYGFVPAASLGLDLSFDALLPAPVKADFAELFVEEKRSSSALLDDGRVEELTSGRDRGAGVRVVVGDSTGFAHTSDLSEAGLLLGTGLLLGLLAAWFVAARNIARIEPRA